MLPNSSYDAPSTLQDTATVYKTGPMIVVGSTKAQGSKAKPTSRVRAPRATRARDEATQWVASSWCILRPIKGPDILKLHI
jgi:hypothetical protein